MVDEDYCVDCGQEIKKPGFMTPGMKFHKFKDGVRCEGCAKQHVENARKKKKK